MSDVSQGPGWWQASDGKWYPPQQAPGAAPQGFAGQPSGGPGGFGGPPGGGPGGFGGPPGGGPGGFGGPAGGPPGFGGPAGLPGQAAYGAPASGGNAAGWGVVAGAGLLVISAFLPWASIEGLITVNGTDGDGGITIVFAIIAAIMGIVAALKGKRWAGITAIVFGLLSFLVGLLNLLDVNGQVIEISPGIGLFLTMLAGIIILISGVLSSKKG